jgi:hypothetical protein
MLPCAPCLELLAMALAAVADERMPAAQRGSGFESRRLHAKRVPERNRSAENPQVRSVCPKIDKVHLQTVARAASGVYRS